MRALWERYISGIKRGIGLCMVCCAAAGWWGVLYPQLTLTQDTYRIVEDVNGCVTVSEGATTDSQAVYRALLNAERGQIRFRSGLWEYVVRLCGSLWEE